MTEKELITDEQIMAAAKLSASAASKDFPYDGADYIWGFQTGAKLILALLSTHTREVAEKAWISVKEKLPDDRTNVIVSYKFGVGEVKYINEKFVQRYDWTTEFPDVTHWQPLPEAPDKETYLNSLKPEGK